MLGNAGHAVGAPRLFFRNLNASPLCFSLIQPREMARRTRACVVMAREHLRYIWLTRMPSRAPVGPLLQPSWCRVDDGEKSLVPTRWGCTRLGDGFKPCVARDRRTIHVSPLPPLEPTVGRVSCKWRPLRVIGRNS